MNFTPLLVALLGVVTVCSSHRSAPYRQRVIEYQSDIYPRDRSYDHEIDRSQVGRPPVAAATFLPRHEDGSLNFDIYPKYAEYLKRNGVTVLHILGTLGGGPILSLAQRKQVIDAWMREAKRLGLHIVVQVGGAPYPVVMATAEYAQKAGVDSLITLPELFYKPTTVEQLVEYIGDVGRAAPHLPVLYYHFPSATGVDFPTSEIMRIAKARVPNFKGIQYESPNLRPISATLNEMDHDDRFVYVGGRLGSSVDMLGVTSVASRVVNIWPKLVSEIVDALSRSDMKRARELQGRLNLAIDAMQAAGHYITALKVTMKMVTGLDVGNPGRPIPALSASARNTLEHRLRELGLVHDH